MNITCANPGCTQTINSLSMKLGMKGTWRIKEDKWFCSHVCYCHYAVIPFIENKKPSPGKSDRRMKLGMLLLKNNLISKESLGEALDTGHNTGKRLGEILVEAGHITDKELKSFLSIQAGMAPVNLDPHLKMRLKDELPFELFAQFQFVIFNFDTKDKVISIAVYEIPYVASIEEYFKTVFPSYLTKFYMEDRVKILEILRNNFPKAQDRFMDTAESDKIESGEIIYPGEGSDDMESVVRLVLGFLKNNAVQEPKVDNIDNALWIKSEIKNIKIDIYLTPNI